MILALDQGTTSSRAIAFDRLGQPLVQASRPFRQIYPQPGWVEHDPMEIWETQLACAKQVLSQVDASQIQAVGITNQRETTILWERATGRPVYNAIVWQCRRTSSRCDELRGTGLEAEIRQRTGLVLDAYFSGTKISWILDQVPGLRQRAEEGEICFGTVDSWLLWQLTGVHATDPSNASRTLLYNIHTGNWDDLLLDKLRVPRAMLPAVRPSSGVFGVTRKEVLGMEVPVAGIAGDQQASLFGQACFWPGEAKNTYGTGLFVVMNTGTTPAAPSPGLITTVAWQIGSETVYAVEGSVFIGGAAVQWLRDELGLVRDAAETESLALSLADNDGVYLVPAFVGLGAPYWDSEARGTLVGLTRGSHRAHFARAALESMAYQTRDVVEAMVKGTDTAIPLLRVDGGATANNWLMQFQADQLGVPVERAQVAETTAQGAAYLAGLGVGLYDSVAAIAHQRPSGDVFLPRQDEAERMRRYQGWQKAVRQARLT